MDQVPGIHRWSDQVRPLSPALVSFLKATLGPGRQWQTDAAHVAPPSRLTAKQVAELVSLDSVVGTDEHAREYASRGMAFIDVVGARAARLPDAVVRPRRADTVQPIIDW